MVKIFSILLFIFFVSTKAYAASNNLFFTTAQFMTYCKSENFYEQGICDGYIIAVNDVIFSLKKEKTNICIPENISIKNIRVSIVNFIIDNAELMSFEANKVIGKFFISNFRCKN
ncbi:Rap1a/Tai family immunity protein [Alphaproteobacteria bacterium]|nr:Rap1a/Tai family immunity protein [Alphaproteobacteria bacterium]